MSQIICQNCGRWHENEKGICPFCRVKPAIRKRQKERPLETDGGIIAVCKKCGERIEFNFNLIDRREYPSRQEDIHVCSENKRDSK